MKSKKFLSLTSLLAGAVSVSAFGVPRAQADVESVNVDPTQSNAVHIIRRHVSDSAITVTREMSEEPVRPWLAEVKVVTQIIHVDPQADYIHQDGTEGRLDENHWILRSQRLANALNAQGVQIIHGNPMPQMASAPRPLMILVKPPMMQQPNKVEPKPIELTPTKPVQPKMPKLTASAEPRD